MTVQVPDDAQQLLGAAYEPMLRYADLLVAVGVPRGLIGPHEAPRLWDRHLLNCLAMAELVPPAATVVDLGSGAGLPGVVLALCLPQLTMTLVDATRRRTDFLTEVVDDLGLADRVSVVWGRAESLRPLRAEVVVARAVAPLGLLAGWSLPHLAPQGTLLAMKGETAPEELARDRRAMARLGFSSPELVTVGGHGSVPITRVVRMTHTGRQRPARQQRGSSASHPPQGRRTLPRPPASSSTERE